MRRLLLALGLALAAPTVAWAGMPSYALNDIVAARLETLSFFLLCFFLLAAVVRLIWNGLRRDFPRLPRLTYGRALGLLAVWGLLFLVVLTMISGARELLTPGAWEKRPGEHTHRLVEGAAPAPDAPDLLEREQNLVDLKTALWGYAAAHGGALPSDALDPDIPSKLWELCRSKARYIYLPGRRVDEGPFPVACEPDVYGEEERFVLLANGEVRLMTPADIQAARKP